MDVLIYNPTVKNVIIKVKINKYITSYIFRDIKHKNDFIHFLSKNIFKYRHIALSRIAQFSILDVHISQTQDVKTDSFL